FSTILAPTTLYPLSLHDALPILSAAGGMESMSNAPYLLFHLRRGARMGNTTAVDAMIHDGLWCALENQHVGMSAELIARRYGIRSEEHTSELQSLRHLVCRLLLE